MRLSVGASDQGRCLHRFFKSSPMRIWVWMERHADLISEGFPTEKCWRPCCARGPTGGGFRRKANGGHVKEFKMHIR